MKKRRLLAFLLVLAIGVSLAISASAAVQWTYISDCTASISKSGNTYSGSGTTGVYYGEGAEYAYVTVYIQEYTGGGWVTRASGSSRSLDFAGKTVTYTTTSTNDFRAKTTHAAQTYDGGYITLETAGPFYDYY